MEFIPLRVLFYRPNRKKENLIGYLLRRGVHRQGFMSKPTKKEKLSCIPVEARDN
jgi:hypothetical protein